MSPAPSALQALAILRTAGDPAQFRWYVIPLLLFTVYVYAEQVQARRWAVVLGGLAFWLMDWINEIWNGLLFHFTQFAPAWGATGSTAFQLLIGLNIEISLMFAVMGVTTLLVLPADPKLKVFGINNRWLSAVVSSILCVCVEYLLHAAGALTWEYRWWNVDAPWLIFLVGYLPFFVVAYKVHDLGDTRRQGTVVAALGAIVVAGLLLFGGLLHWI